MERLLLFLFPERDLPGLPVWAACISVSTIVHSDGNEVGGVQCGALCRYDRKLCKTRMLVRGKLCDRAGVSRFGEALCQSRTGRSMLI